MKKKILILLSFIFFLDCFFSKRANAQDVEVIVPPILAGSRSQAEYYIINNSGEEIRVQIRLGGRTDTPLASYQISPNSARTIEGFWYLETPGDYPVQVIVTRESGSEETVSNTLTVASTEAELQELLESGDFGSIVTGATRPEECGDGGIVTAIGCIPTQPQALIASLLKWGISMAGGIAFLLMLWGGFQYIISTGNPEKLQAAQQILSSAIAGLLIIIFAVFLLRLIGVTILKIPGFG